MTKSKNSLPNIMKYGLGPLVAPIGLGRLVELGRESDVGEASSSAIDDSEVNRIKKLIRHGKEQGLQEISIEINKDFARAFKSQIGFVLDGFPLNASIDADADKKGGFILNIKFLKITPAEEIASYHKLLKNRAITESEFSEIKQKIIHSIGGNDTTKA